MGTTWKTLWRAIRPVLEGLAGDEARFAGVRTLGVDEHVWHHVDPRKRGPKELTGMVDLTRDEDGVTHARLLDLVPGRSGKAYAGWLKGRGPAFRDGVEIAALDPFAGYKTAIDEQLDDATAVLDAFHVVKLGTGAVDEVRRRVQQETLGHRGRKGDPLYGVQTILRAGRERLTEKQRARLARAIEADPAHEEVLVAWQCAQQLRDAYRQEDLAAGRRIADHNAGEQRRHRGDQRHHRAPSTPRPRVPQPRQLPAPDAPRRRRPHALTPTQCPKSPLFA
jgi:hypothetical protein